MKKFISLLLTITVFFSFSLQVCAFDINKIDDTIVNTGNYLYQTVKEPNVGSIGGEWAVLGLARSNIDIPDEYFENYYQRVTKYVKDCQGILHSKKYTEYSRVAVALTSIGKNPEDISGYNLLTPLSDYEKTIWQGINGAIWALIALDCGNYDFPLNTQAKIQATREMYINYILNKQTPDGGWALSGNIADPDITGMALQALSNYQDNENVNSATKKALNCLSEIQNENGGFSTYKEETSESSVQVLVALCELDIPVSDSRFIKNGNTILDNILSYYDNKGFKHTKEGSVNLMATEQCFYALVALDRANKSESSLYDMSDAIKLNAVLNSSGLLKKHGDVKKTSILKPGKTFEDTKNHKEKAAIEALASREIINGKTENNFDPQSTMTRAEFATIITKGLGLYKENNAIFNDVTPNDWFYNYVGTAYSYGIIKGVSYNEFNPNGTITREEAAVMVTRAAELCGLDTKTDTFTNRDILSQFFDYVESSDWAQGSLAFCYKNKILSDEVMDIKPKEPVTRAEIAFMLFNMLLCAGLL